MFSLTRTTLPLTHLPQFNSLKPSLANPHNMSYITKLFFSAMCHERNKNSHLHNALDHSTLKEIIKALRAGVNAGEDINQKMAWRNRCSLLAQVYSFRDYDCISDELGKELLSLGATFDYKEYQEGSPLHEVLFYVGSVQKKIKAIKLFTDNGVDVNYLNQDRSTALDYARYFNSNKEGEKFIVKALKIRGAVHGFGYHAPDISPFYIPYQLSCMAITRFRNTNKI